MRDVNKEKKESRSDFVKRWTTVSFGRPDYNFLKVHYMLTPYPPLLVRRDLAGGAAHLALARVGGHDAGGTQCGTGGHADQERGGGACVFVFHRRHSLRIKIFGLRG